jgi:hypothetical protein
MGLGVAKLLVAHNYRVLTNVSDRSTATQKRAQDAQLGLVPNDIELVAKSDYILSIVPPSDAVAIAGRIIDALNSSPTPRQSPASPLYYLDLNAVSPNTVNSIAEAFKQQAPGVRFIDGGIIGGPPSPSPDSTSWKRPGIPLSGPHALHDAPLSGKHLAETLNTTYQGTEIGSASGLKCCFAALSKGFTALALQSFGTASTLGVLPSLLKYLDEYNPQARQKAEKGIVGCPSKAYRWVEEMNQIGECFAVDGGWAEQAKVFREIAGVYEGLAKVVEAKGGAEGLKSAENVVDTLGDGLRRKKRGRRMSVEELDVDEG